MHLEGRFFRAIKNGSKTVEGRLGNKSNGLKVGDIIQFISHENGEKINVKILRMNYYDTFREMLVKEGLERVLPGAQSIEDGLEVYLKPDGFYTSEDEMKERVVAFEIFFID